MLRPGCADYLRFPIDPRTSGSGDGNPYKLSSGLEGLSARGDTLLAEDPWYDIVSEYSNCYLTEGKDKLPAISGIARILAKRIESRYIAGIWKENLSYGLAWHVPSQDQRSSLRPARYPAPSWSWASCERRVRWPCKACVSPRRLDLREPCTTESVRPFAVSGSDTWVPCLDIDNVEILLLDENNPFGEVKEGRLKISGKLRSVAVPGPNAGDWTQGMGQASSPAVSRVIRPYFDAEERKLGHTAELQTLLLGIRINRLPSVDCIDVWSMILQEVIPGSNVFRRIGITEDAVNDEVTAKEDWTMPEPADGKYRIIVLV